MKKISFILSCVLLVTVLMTSCKKDDTSPTPTPTPTPTPSNPIPAIPSNVSGVLVAIQTQTKPPIVIPGVPIQMINVGLAVALFPSGTAGVNYNAGNVSVNTFQLTKDTSNMYMYTPGATNPLGLEFTTPPSWTVSGSANVPAFNATAYAFPSDVNVTSATTVNVSSAYSLTCDPVTGADSLIFAVHGPSASIIKTKAGNVSSYSFSAADLATVGKGVGYIQITAYRMKPVVNSNKTYWVINENVATIGATFQ